MKGPKFINSNLLSIIALLFSAVATLTSGFTFFYTFIHESHEIGLSVVQFEMRGSNGSIDCEINYVNKGTTDATILEEDIALIPIDINPSEEVVKGHILYKGSSRMSSELPAGKQDVRGFSASAGVTFKDKDFSITSSSGIAQAILIINYVNSEKGKQTDYVKIGEISFRDKYTVKSLNIDYEFHILD